MSIRRRPRRWSLPVAVILASATALLLGGALATGDRGGARTSLVAAATACFCLTVILGSWMIRRGDGDPELERAETAEHLADELRGPLLSLRSLSASAMRDGAEMTEEDRAAFFALIDDEAARLRRTVEQLSTALRIEAGTIRYDLREEDLGSLLEETATEAPHGDHPLGVKVEPDLRVRVDRVRLGEALAAVVDNAARFSPPDAPIEIRAFRSEDGTTVVEVSDHGPGIPVRNRQEVFRRGVTRRPPGYEETPGAGVGLFVARAHLLGHGGELRIEDRPQTDEDDGPGTVVRITLPPLT